MFECSATYKLALILNWARFTVIDLKVDGMLFICLERRNTFIVFETIK